LFKIGLTLARILLDAGATISAREDVYRSTPLAFAVNPNICPACAPWTWSCLRFVEAPYSPSHDAIATSYPSARSARAGSTRAARIAGNSHATSAAHVSTATAAPYVSGSVARIANNR
jgi:hypothetical protein